MGSMGQQAKGNNVVLFAEVDEVNRTMGLIAIEDQHAISTDQLFDAMILKVLQPMQAQLVIRVSRF
jgi:hypothetical protein